MLYTVKENNGVKTLTPLEELTTIDLAVMQIKAYFKNLWKKIKIVYGVILEYTKTT